MIVELGMQIDLDATDLGDGSGWVTGNWMRLEGTAQVEAVLTGVFDGMTALTGIEVRYVISDDRSRIDPIVCIKSSTGAVVTSVTLAPGALGERIRCVDHIAARYVALQAKAQGGTASGADAVSATVRAVDGQRSEIA